MFGVAKQKLSIALEDRIAQAAKQSAERRGMSLSAWLNEVSRNALAVEDGLIAVAEWEAEYGEPTPEELTAADEALQQVSVN